MKLLINFMREQTRDNSQNRNRMVEVTFPCLLWRTCKQPASRNVNALTKEDTKDTMETGKDDPKDRTNSATDVETRARQRIILRRKIAEILTLCPVLAGERRRTTGSVRMMKIVGRYTRTVSLKHSVR